MIRVVVGLALFFFVVTLGQLSYLHWELRRPHESTVPDAAAQLINAPIDEDAPAADRARLGFAALLESEATARRYEMGTVVLMAHLWIRYLGFVTGMIMAFIGSIFILGKLRDTNSTQLGAEAQTLKVSLSSASPGLVLAVLGSIMMMITVLAQQTTEVKDRALYSPFAENATAPVPTVPDFFRDAPAPDD